MEIERVISAHSQMSARFSPPAHYSSMSDKKTTQVHAGVSASKGGGATVHGGVTHTRPSGTSIQAGGAFNTITGPSVSIEVSHTFKH